MVYEGYLSNAEEDVEGAIPVIIKTVKGELATFTTFTTSISYFYQLLLATFTNFYYFTTFISYFYYFY